MKSFTSRPREKQNRIGLKVAFSLSPRNAVCSILLVGIRLMRATAQSVSRFVSSFYFALARSSRV